MKSPGGCPHPSPTPTVDMPSGHGAGVVVGVPGLTGETAPGA